MAPGLIFLALHFSVANHVLQRKVFAYLFSRSTGLNSLT